MALMSCTRVLLMAASVAPAGGDCVPREIVTIVPDEIASGALFGTEIAAAGGAAVGSAIAEPASSGSLFVLACDGDGWGDVVRLLPSDLGAGSFSMALGWSVAMDEGIILGGAPFYDIDGAGFGEGAVFVFRLDEDAWGEETILTASDAVAADRFGLAVAVHGDLAVIGAPGVDERAGAAYVFRFDGVAWTEEARLTGSDTVAEDGFGFGVACDGGRVYVGAVGGEPTGAPGRVYVFEHDGETWTEAALVASWDTDEPNGFGAQVEVDGNRMIVGASGDDEHGLNAGAAYIFEYDGAAWQPVIKLAPADAHLHQAFGIEVGIRGDLAVVSASLDDELGFQSGAAYLFRREATGWMELAKITASDGAVEHRFGDGLALAGNTLLVGAPFRDEPTNQAGAVYAFELCPHPADLDASGDVGFGDLLILLSGWGPCPPECPADLNGNGQVDFPDLLLLLHDWGSC